MTEHAVVAALERTIAGWPTRRVPLPDLLASAASVDRTAAAAAGWRTRVLVALSMLAESGAVAIPRTRMDRTAHPPLPAYVTRPAAPRTPRPSAEAVVWHIDLAWAADLDDRGELTVVDRRFLVPVNRWLSRRRGFPVPMRERSLEIFGDEKVLESRLFGPLFGPDRLTYALLEAFPCWPPVEQTVLGDGPWLLIENYTTYHSLSVRSRELGYPGRVIWGSGLQVGTRLSALAAAGEAPTSIWYFGDIDTGGLRAARLAERRSAEVGYGPVVPARGLYRLALALGEETSRGSSAPAELACWARSWLGGGLGDTAAGVASRNGQIVQEHVGGEVLAGLSFDRWFT